MGKVLPGKEKKGQLKVGIKVSSDLWGQFFEIVGKSKQELVTYIEKIAKGLIPIHIYSALNLAIRCKKFKLYELGLYILEEVKGSEIL